MKPIAIVGGGLAGLTLGIGLRQRGVPVMICEAGHYPRHRVCGEFINGGGQDVLSRLGLMGGLVKAGAVPARTAAFISESSHSPVRSLPQHGLCLSRFTLDALLAREFTKLGGDLREGKRWDEDECEAGVVRASGRRLQPIEDGWRWFGLKVHAGKVRLMADLEMHLALNGYVGMCRLNHEQVNVCGLFRRSLRDKETVRGWRELLLGVPGTMVHERLAKAEFDESSFCSVAGLSLRSQGASAQTECCIGDTITMIPPVTGNGMSMAFESAELAIEPMAGYSREELTWSEAKLAIACACDRAFRRRLRWARWLQWMMFTPRLQNRLGTLALRSGWLWQLLFAKTR